MSGTNANVPRIVDVTGNRDGLAGERDDDVVAGLENRAEGKSLAVSENVCRGDVAR